jgi:hypothetical protein
MQGTETTSPIEDARRENILAMPTSETRLPFSPLVRLPYSIRTSSSSLWDGVSGGDVGLLMEIYLCMLAPIAVLGRYLDSVKRSFRLQAHAQMA